MRHLLRAVLTAALRALGILLYRAHLQGPVIRAGRRRVRVLLYHACEESEHDWIVGLRSNTPPKQFETHLQFLQRHYTVVALERLMRGDYPDCAAAITFDDGYRSVYDNALPLLRARGFPATVYLVTTAVGNRALVWVNELNWFVRRHSDVAMPLAKQRLGLPETASAEMIIEAAIAQYDPALVASLLADLRRHTGLVAESLAAEAALYLSWDEVQEMVEYRISFGNHTATHPNLTRLDAEGQHAEIAGAHEVLTRKLGECTSFAYPFGTRDARSQRVAQRVGYTMTLEVGGGNERPQLERLGRLPVRAVGEAELFADLEVVAPVVAWARRVRDRLSGCRFAARRGGHA